MSDCINSICGCIDDLWIRLDTDRSGRERLLTVHKDTKRGSVALFEGGRQVLVVFGRVYRGYLIADRAMADGRRWLYLG